MRAVLCSSLGYVLGLLLVAGVSTFGLGALLSTSASAFMFAKYLGALYLVYLGVKQFRKRELVLSAGANAPGQRHRPAGALFREGVLVAVTNPKVIALFSAMFPVFLDTAQPVGAQFVVMTATMMTLSLLCLLGYGVLARSARRWLSVPHRQRWFHRVAGSVFIVMGAGLTALGRNGH